MAAMDSLRKKYDGWIDVQQSTSHNIDGYTNELIFEFDGGWIAVHHFGYEGEISSAWSTRENCYVFDLSLNSRPSTSKITYHSPQSRADASAMGRLFMVPPGQSVICRGNGGYSRSMRCFLDARLIDELLPEPPIWDNNFLSRQDILALGGGEIEWVLRRMYREVNGEKFSARKVIELLARQLGIEVIRTFQLDAGSEQPRSGGVAPWRMRLLRNRVFAEGPLPTVSELAELCDITVRHLGRAFLAETGMTIGKFVEAAFVDRANAMLLEGRSVEDVAVTLGYATSGSFSKAFKRATGLLPSDQRVPRKDLMYN